MKTSLQITSDIQIPDRLYNEAAELFLNHLKEYYAMQLLTGDNLLQSSEKRQQNKNVQLVIHHSLSCLGKTCPLYYKSRKDADNARPHYQKRIVNIQ